MSSSYLSATDRWFCKACHGWAVKAVSVLHADVRKDEYGLNALTQRSVNSENKFSSWLLLYFNLFCCFIRGFVMLSTYQCRLSHCSVAVQSHDQGNCDKVFNWRLACSFRGLVHISSLLTETSCQVKIKRPQQLFLDAEGHFTTSSLLSLTLKSEPCGWSYQILLLAEAGPCSMTSASAFCVSWFPSPLKLLIPFHKSEA